MSILGFLLSLNLQTTTFLSGIAMLIQAAVIGFQSLLIRAYKGIRTAALANLANAVGLLLIGFRGSLSPWVTVILANDLVMLGAVLHYISICRFISSKYNRLLILLCTLPVFVLFPYYTFMEENLVLRMVIISFGAAALMGAVSLKLLETRQSGYRVSSYLLAMVSGVYMIVLLVRGVGVLVYPPKDLFTQNLILAFHNIVLFIASLLWASGFTLMVGQRLQVDLDELSTLDSLTRVSNRRGMTRQLEAEFARNDHVYSGFSILLVDVDKFKSINDQHGHHIGDVVLQQMADTMKSFVRPQDFVSRWGGEEFMILLPATRLNEAVVVGKRLCRQIERERFVSRDKALPLTISVGVASSDGCFSLQEIYAHADQALYKAKQMRNTVAAQEHIRNGEEIYLAS